jgi:16S rRNA C1402 (ribose-2'-O) methylase RsmI
MNHPYRLVKTLGDLASVLGADREASVARELQRFLKRNVRGTYHIYQNILRHILRRAKSLLLLPV